MICVGWMGVTHSRRERSGSTAAGVARTAHSAVAVIRRRHANPFPTNLWIVGVGQSPGSDAVLRTALDEARLREAPLLNVHNVHWGGEHHLRCR
jgi:nucleotide-binding universal stress UspA family protein